MPTIQAGRPVKLQVKPGPSRVQATVSKPPYRVPLMAEIAAIPYNGFNVVSTFSGCGGSCLGYRIAGFRVLWANEFIPAAQVTYRANHPKTILDIRDIRQVQPADILSVLNLEPGQIDLLDGSPPCASFSTAGKRQAGWGKVKAYSDTTQRTDDLFFEFARLLGGLQPKTFVAENVSGLVKGTAKGYFLEILAALKACGYRVKAKVLDAQWLGVPQARQRLIFVGVRNDLGLEPVHPKPLAYRYSVRDALPWITTFRTKNEVIESSSPAPTVLTHGRRQTTSEFTVEAETWMDGYAVGRKWEQLQEGGHEFYGTGFHRTHRDKPCPTVTQRGGDPSVASVSHPTEKRKFSIAELKRICAFPDDFILTGTYAQQWERLGRAVPPVMMQHIAVAVRDGILRKLPV